jgi:hypothetical protein
MRRGQKKGGAIQGDVPPFEMDDLKPITKPF